MVCAKGEEDGRPAVLRNVSSLLESVCSAVDNLGARKVTDALSAYDFAVLLQMDFGRTPPVLGLLERRVVCEYCRIMNASTKRGAVFVDTALESFKVDDYDWIGLVCYVKSDPFLAVLNVAEKRIELFACRQVSEDTWKKRRLERVHRVFPTSRKWNWNVVFQGSGDMDSNLCLVLWTSSLFQFKGHIPSLRWEEEAEKDVRLKIAYELYTRMSMPSELSLAGLVTLFSAGPRLLRRLA